MSRKGCSTYTPSHAGGPGGNLQGSLQMLLMLLGSPGTDSQQSKQKHKLSVMLHWLLHYVRTCLYPYLWSCNFTNVTNKTECLFLISFYVYDSRYTLLKACTHQIGLSKHQTLFRVWTSYTRNIQIKLKHSISRHDLLIHMKHKFQHVDTDNHPIKTVSVITTFQTHQDNYHTLKTF